MNDIRIFLNDSAIINRKIVRRFEMGHTTLAVIQLHPWSIQLYTTTIVVYAIQCRTCNKTNPERRLADRFREHLRSTRNTIDLPVGRHFASLDHSTSDMAVSVPVIRSGFSSTMDRCRAEARIIFKHKTLHPRGVNIYFAFTYKLLSTAFNSARSLYERRFIFELHHTRPVC